MGAGSEKAEGWAGDSIRLDTGSSTTMEEYDAILDSCSTGSIASVGWG